MVGLHDSFIKLHKTLVSTSQTMTQCPWERSFKYCPKQKFCESDNIHVPKLRFRKNDVSYYKNCLCWWKSYWVQKIILRSVFMLTWHFWQKCIHFLALFYNGKIEWHLQNTMMYQQFQFTNKITSFITIKARSESVNVGILTA